jgi:hypothetical protein
MPNKERRVKREKVCHRTSDLALGRMAEQLAGGWDTIRRLSRRRLLRAGAAAAGGALLGSVFGFFGGEKRAAADQAVKTGQFIFPRLQFSVKDETVDRWNVGPVGDVNLRKKLMELTNINVSLEPKVVRLGDFDELCRHPFVFMTSEGYFDLPAQEEWNLREFLERGGFVLADDCVYVAREDRFFRDYVKLINKLFPDNPVRKIPLDNEIYHIYYDFPRGSPHMQGVPHGAHGLFERGTGRIMTYIDPGDMHCGWMMQYWANEKNIEAIKMGINVIIYFLTH